MAKKDILIIKELPIFQWTQNYKEFLEKMLDVEMNKPSNKRRFTYYKDNNTDENIFIEIEFNKDMIPSNENIEKEFKLVKKISLTNMHLYSTNGSIKKYKSIKDIMMEYFNERVKLYEDRKQYQLNIIKNELDLMSYKCKFILLVVEKKLIINNRKRKDIEKDLVELEFPKLGDTIDSTNKTYNYLLNMPIYNLTFEKIEELKKQIELKEAYYNLLLNKTSCDIWKDELKELKLLL